VTSATRSKALPDIPTMTEFYPGFEVTSWGGLVGPPGLPLPVVDRLSGLTRRALESEDLLRIFDDNAATAWWTTPEDFATFRGQQDTLFAELVKVSGARVD
jgi:tripartite-type tricarboxylate transporter receptor subunit TctC